jgi:protoporphyrinogen/coproporphyrinogen III oxidase
MKRVIIVGGGISGLAIAWNLRWSDPGAAITVLEATSVAGGNARTLYEEGYTCESGPDGFLDNAPETLRLVDELGLRPRLLRSSDASRRRFIFFKGGLEPAPTSPVSFFRSRLLTARGKMRLLCEPFAGGPPKGIDESIHEFAARRIGNEAAAVLIDAMVSGVFAGDANALSLRAALPKMWEIEHQYGSLFKALIATRKTRKPEDVAAAPSGTLTSFKTGMGELTAALSRQLGSAVHTHAPVTGVTPTSGTGTWLVTSNATRYEAEAVVLAGPASESAQLVDSFDPQLGSELGGIRTAPLTVVCLGYDAAAAGDLTGFGFLAPRSQRLRILGALWETSIYPDRAPAGKVLLRVMIGGARDSDAVNLTDPALIACVREDLRRAMGLTATPEFVRILRHWRGIPQYNRGHLDRMRRLDDLLQAHPGLYLAGNSYRGVSLNACVTDAARIAEAVRGALQGASYSMPA